MGEGEIYKEHCTCTCKCGKHPMKVRTLLRGSKTGDTEGGRLETIAITQGNPDSKAGFLLNGMALGNQAYPLAGSRDPSIIDETLKRLWKRGSNRFSHQYAFEAQMGGKAAGMVICYPVSLMGRLALPTTLQLLQIRKLALVRYGLSHWPEEWAMMTLHEGENDEFHISTLAILPEFQGLGIGTRLIGFAEKQAERMNYRKCSLTVKKENSRALRLYQRLGFELVGSIDKPCNSLYRMRKVLPPGRSL
jgi:ribosomal protein S18 acetylase RimI-like enzyme